MSAPWEQLGSESPEAYAAFVWYRDLGASRSLAKAYACHVAAPGGPSKAPIRPQRGLAVPGTWKRWSRQHDWVSRAQAYDEHLDRLSRRGTEATIVDMASDWARRREELREQEYLLGKRMLALAADALGRIEKSSAEQNAPPALKIHELERLAVAASKLQRLAVGLATERGQDERPVEELSDEELEAVVASGVAEDDARLH